MEERRVGLGNLVSTELWTIGKCDGKVQNAAVLQVENRFLDVACAATMAHFGQGAPLKAEQSHRSSYIASCLSLKRSAVVFGPKLID